MENRLRDYAGSCAVQLAGVCKRYGDFALQDVSFSLPTGCVLGLIGENGAGKSTLMRMMLGCCAPDSGSVRVLGQEAGASREFAALRNDIGVVLDDACLPEELTVAQTARMMRGIYTGWDDKVFDALARRFALPGDKVVRQLSRGTRMKLALACAMSHGARLLVLDEATGGLDPVVRDDVLDLLNDFTREESHSVLISSHIVSDLEKICDYIVFLHEGRVLLADEKDALAERYAMLTLGEGELATLDSGCALRVLRSHGAVRALVLRERLPAGLQAERCAIEDIMLLLTKGEELDHARNTL